MIYDALKNLNHTACSNSCILVLVLKVVLLGICPHASLAFDQVDTRSALSTQQPKLSTNPCYLQHTT